MDPRFEQFAGKLVNYSLEVKPGNIVIVDTFEGTPAEMVMAIIRKVYEAGAYPIPWRMNHQILREVLKGKVHRRLFRFMGMRDLVQLMAADKYIAIRDFSNFFELEDVPTENMNLMNQHYIGMIMDERIEFTDWVITRWPTPSFAQLASMSTEKMTELYFKVVLLDYSKMAKAMQPMRKLLLKTDKVRIAGPGTDLRFSIKGIGAVPCFGKRNIPDGEIYTAPVKNSVNGIVSFNTKAVTKDGRLYEGLVLEFKDGKIVKASCRSGDINAFNKMLDTDNGSRYLGEFGIGVNPHITRTIGEILFDEKVRGTIHLAAGMAYDKAFNGNKSSIHQDIVLDQNPEMGGGSIYFDGKLVRKDGLFVTKELRCLNPENLI